MKTVSMERDYTYRAKYNVHIQYIGGETYQRVPEAAVRAITQAGAGEVIKTVEPTSELACGGYLPPREYVVGE